MATELSTDIRAGIERAWAALDEDAIGQLVFDMTSIPSPSGEERRLAAFVADHLKRAGLEAGIQEVAGEQANLVARIRGTGDGPSVMLYAPLDTAFSGDREEDRPFLGDDPRPDFALPPRRDGSLVIGLGAENPKGFAAAAIAAVQAVAQASVEPRGDIVLALASGSMPVDRRPGVERAPVGFGTGIRHLLDAGPRPDFAVVLKPGYTVAHAEVGLAWFQIAIRGAVNYTGIRHKGPYRNPILAAARVVGELEAWFAGFSDRHADESVMPQGSINAIRAGSPDQASFIPAHCEIDLDLRIGPRTSAVAVEAELSALIEELRGADPDIAISLERRFALPGTHTDPDSAVVRALVRAWEAREGKEHAPPARTSGASDAAIIRDSGIPTARIGLPPPSTPSPYAGFSMGVVDVTSVHRLAEVLAYAMIDLSAKNRAEAGLA